MNPVVRLRTLASRLKPENLFTDPGDEPCPVFGDGCPHAEDGRHDCEGTRGHIGIQHFCLYCRDWF